MNTPIINSSINVKNNQAFDRVNLPVKHIQAFQTTRFHPHHQNLPFLHQFSNEFDDFNLGLHVNDNPIIVNKNRQILLNFLPEQSHIQWLNQVHGSQVEIITDISSHVLTADAMITSQPKLALAIMTADCLPILLTSKKGDEIAAIHGGWRSLANNIIQNTLDKMVTSNEDIYAWLGPCIGANSFEVGEEVVANFANISSHYSQAFKNNNNSKWLGDLSLIAEWMLKREGIHQVKKEHACTFTESTRYYSYRKSSKTGRMAAIICIK